MSREAVAFFDDAFSMSAIEKVAEVRTTMSSAGAVEVRRPGEGEPTDEELSSFPLAAGAHLPMTSPALEFTKIVTHLVGLDPLLEDGVVRLRRNLLQLLAVQEFAPEARFVNPCRTFCEQRLFTPAAVNRRASSTRAGPSVNSVSSHLLL